MLVWVYAIMISIHKGSSGYLWYSQELTVKRDHVDHPTMSEWFNWIINLILDNHYSYNLYPIAWMTSLVCIAWRIAQISHPGSVKASRNGQYRAISLQNTWKFTVTVQLIKILLLPPFVSLTIIVPSWKISAIKVCELWVNCMSSYHHIIWYHTSSSTSSCASSLFMLSIFRVKLLTLVIHSGTDLLSA